MVLSEAAIGLDASYPAQPPQVASIRRAVSGIARRGGADIATLIRLELAISEAATNVVLHAYRAPGAGGRIHITACIDLGVLDVCVRDHGCGMAPRPDSPGMGLGLSLMASESDHFEVRKADGGGTEVLLRFLLTARDAPPRERIARRTASGAPATA
jgi:anti-sigma regulatory factor (Ser/Thr protein kinase)